MKEIHVTSRCTSAKKNEITQKGKVVARREGGYTTGVSLSWKSQFPLVEIDNDPLPTTDVYVIRNCTKHRSTYLCTVAYQRYLIRRFSLLEKKK